ncbi:MAG: TonB-dependent receptor [Cyclobacteriaceae bacterium]|nr:TonB-dependent receptor [Cyclobacteriaceae bacterium]
MRLIAVSFLSQILLLLTVQAQFRVTLIDKGTDKGIEGALVYASSPDGKLLAQDVSDQNGMANLKLSSFPARISTSHIGFQPTLREVEHSGDVVIELDALMHQLEEVVVTGQFEPQSAHQSVYRVRTISSDRIQAVGSTRLQDVLNTELNIRFSQDLALGGSNLSMQGLAGQNVKVLIDGVPMVGRQGTGNEININQININTIERIEIVEGPMSVIYGADALAGVINIITKRPEDDKWNASIRLHEESVGNEYGFQKGIHNESVSLGYSHNSWYASADLTRNFFGGWQGSAEDRDKEWHPKTQWMAGGVTGFRKGDTDIYYRLDYLNENIYNPGIFSGIEAIDQRYITNRFMHQVQASLKISERWKYNGALSYTDFSRKTQTTTVNRNTGDERLAIGPGLQDLTEFDGITFRGTFLFKPVGKISFQSGYDVNIENGSGGRLQDGVSSIQDYALFASAEYKPAEWLSFRPGVRFIKNSAYDAPPAVPTLNVKMQVSEKNDLRLSYGRGFRAPSIRELYFNFFDASHSIEGNPDLEAELSHSYNVAWTSRLIRQDAFTYDLTITGFYNTVDNMIGYGVKPGNAAITTYINIDQYKTKGFTWLNSVRYKSIQASAGFGYTGRYNDLTSGNEGSTEFIWSPEVNTNVTWSWPSIRSSLSLYYKYTGVTPYYVVDADGNTEIDETEDFHWADLSLQKSLFKSFNVSAGVRNLFNVTRINNSAADGGSAHGGGATRPVGYGRSFFFSLTYKI